jgi:hypothetical protein
MRCAAHLSRTDMTWWTSLPVATQPRLSPNGSPPAADTYFSTRIYSPELEIAKRIGDIGEPCWTPASTRCLSVAFPSITISTVLYDKKLTIPRTRTLSISLTVIKLTNRPFAMLGKAVSMSIRSTPVLWPFVQSASDLSTIMAAALMAGCPFLLRNCPSLGRPLFLA